MLRTMSFVKVNIVLKTDRQTDRPTDLSIEATCRRLKKLHWTQKACALLAELGTAQPPLVLAISGVEIRSNH